MDHREKCNLCGSDNIIPKFVKDGIPYFECVDCRFQFARPKINPNLSNDWGDYEPSYISYFEETAEDAVTLGELTDWIEGFSKTADKKVLDVGSGSGKLVRHLRSRGALAIGLEPARPLYEQFLSDAPDTFYNCTLNEFRDQRTEEQFDILIASDVIEHVEEPLEMLAVLRDMARPNATLFLITPDAGSLLARTMGRWWHYYNKYHLSYLSRTTLNNLCERAGLEVIQVGTLSRKKSLFYLVQYLADVVIGTDKIQVPRFLEKLSIPVNLFDTLYAAIRLKQPD